MASELEVEKIKAGDGTTTAIAGADDVIIAQSSGDAGVTIRTPNNSTGQICFADGNTGNEAYRGYIGYKHGTGEALNLGSGGETALSINTSGKTTANALKVLDPTHARYFDFVLDSSASYLDVSHALNVRVNGASSLTNALTIDTSGLATFSNGIAFSQTNSTAASNITTTLDHYERGVWTPVIADAATGGNTGSGSTVTGYYERIGNAVTVTGLATNVNTAGMTGANVLFVRGLPFPAGYTSGTFGNLGRAVGSCVLDAVDLEASTRSVSTMIIGQNSYFTFHQTRDAVGDSNILVSNLSSGTADLFFTLTYFVD